MFYGDIQFIDILLFAGIAAFLLYRLNNILGRRTGFDKKSTASPIENSEISPIKQLTTLITQCFWKEQRQLLKQY